MKNDDWDDYIPEGHQDTTVWEIGDITFSEDIINEGEAVGDRILNIKSIGECKIEVYTVNEGQIPHFHLFKKDHSFETCICIYSPNFFSHGGKYRDVLNRKQCKILDEYLRQPTKFSPNISIWESIQIIWESGNQKTCRFPENRKVYSQPDYSSMTQFKDV